MTDPSALLERSGLWVPCPWFALEGRFTRPALELSLWWVLVVSVPMVGNEDEWFSLWPEERPQ